MRSRRSFGVFVAVTVMTAATWTATAGSAAAVANPTIVVTTTADVVNASDGVLSLREAVALANAIPGFDLIQLAAGATYDLTICGADGATPDSTGDLIATDTAGLFVYGDPANRSTGRPPTRLVGSGSSPASPVSSSARTCSLRAGSEARRMRLARCR
jgi:CSLREA domain-containing protein